MKFIPRIGGAWWSVCVLLALFLFLLPGASAQDAGAGAPGEAVTGGTAADTESGDTSAAEGEGDAVDMSVVSDEALEVQLLVPESEPVYNWNFQKPANVEIMDRSNDEGGAFALVWGPSESDSETIMIPDPTTGEPVEASAYGYWVFQSETGEPGTWEMADQFPANTRYTWEKPNYFGFFMSEAHKGAENHYSIYENQYPAFGIYEYSIDMIRIPDPEKPDDPSAMIIDPTKTNQVMVTAMVFGRNSPDYSTLQVKCDLSGFGGDVVTLTYQPPEPGAEPAPWDNVFTGIGTIVPERVNIAKPYWVLFTSTGGGIPKSVLEVQPTVDRTTNVVIVSGAGSEPPVPDNRFSHLFRVYAVPTGYMLPDGSDLPPDEWMLGNQLGPITAKPNIWNGARTNSALWAILICLAVMGYIYRAKRGASLFLRRIAGLDHVEEAIGRATEMGRPILYTTGLGYVSDIATIASINILGQVARKVADYESRLMVPSRDPIVMAVCQEVIHEAYIDAGRPDSYNKDDVFFLTDDQFAYTAAVNGIMVREKPATIILMGLFYAESLLLAETGASTGAIQIAGTDALAQLPFFITACDYTLIGEELYAASAYLSREPLLVGSLKGQDLAKLIFMILTFIGTLLMFVNVEFVGKLFQAF